MESIIKKYLEGQATEQEQERLLTWLRDRKNRFAFKRYKLIWEKSPDRDQLPGKSLESWNMIQGKLLQMGFKEWQISRRTQNIFRYAAIFFFVLSIGSLAWIYLDRSEETPELLSRILTDYGQISKVVLPDGSFVWLNYGSEIEYNNNFAFDNRNIVLKGEGYFVVTKNKKLPFIVSCDNVQVKSLGTSFNISSYSGSETVDVVLESGLIELKRKDTDSFRKILVPGKLAVLGKNDPLFYEKEINTLKFTSWRTGIINIYNQPIEKAVDRLELRYNQKFRVDEDVKRFHYTFTIRNESLDDIITLMESITPVRAVQENETIVFKLDKEKADNLK